MIPAGLQNKNKDNKDSPAIAACDNGGVFYYARAETAAGKGAFAAGRFRPFLNKLVLCFRPGRRHRRVDFFEKDLTTGEI